MPQTHIGFHWSRLASPWLAALVGALAAAWLSIPAPAYWRHVADSPPSWTTGEIDTGLIHGGLVAAPGFQETLRWWTGPWVGQVPFYRPLTSYLFWFEWKAFGDTEYLYLIPAIVAHVLACALFGILAFRLAERYRVDAPVTAGVVGALGFSGVFASQRLVVDLAVANAWKNQPDAWAAICSTAALLFCLRARQRTRWDLPIAVGFYLAACGFKEIALPLPLVCIALEMDSIRDRGARPALMRLVPMFGAAGVFVALRFLAIGGLGYTYGSNRAWFMRTLEEAFGPFGTPLVIGHWLGPALATWMYLVALGYWRLRSRIRVGANRRRSQIALTVGTLAVALVGASLLGRAYLHRVGYVPGGGGPTDDWAAGLLLVVGSETLRSTLPCLLALAAATTLVIRCPPALGVAIVWTWAFLLPLVFSPGPLHRYYLSQAGYILCYSLAAGFWAVGAGRALSRGSQISDTSS